MILCYGGLGIFLKPMKLWMGIFNNSFLIILEIKWVYLDI